MRSTYTIQEVTEIKPWSEEFVWQCIECEWIELANPNLHELDEEDLARLQLIQELRENLEVNDEAIPIVLHLVDQLNYLHGELRSLQDRL